MQRLMRHQKDSGLSNLLISSHVQDKYFGIKIPLGFVNGRNDSAADNFLPTFSCPLKFSRKRFNRGGGWNGGFQGRNSKLKMVLLRAELTILAEWTAGEWTNSLQFLSRQVFQTAVSQDKGLWQV